MIQCYAGNVEIGFILRPPLCDKAVKLTLRTSAEYSAGYKRRTTIYLTMQQRGNNWFVVEMAADYDS